MSTSSDSGAGLPARGEIFSLMFVSRPALACRSGESRNLAHLLAANPFRSHWVPACTGMTDWNVATLGGCSGSSRVIPPFPIAPDQGVGRAVVVEFGFA